MQKLVILLTYSALLLLTSCELNDYPYVRIKTPTKGQVFNAPGVIKIEAEFQSGDAIANEDLIVIKVNATNNTILHNTGQGWRGNQMVHIIDSFISEPATKYKIIASGVGGSGWSYDSIVVSTN